MEACDAVGKLAELEETDEEEDEVLEEGELEVELETDGLTIVGLVLEAAAVGY